MEIETPVRRWSLIHVFATRWWAFVLGGLLLSSAIGLALSFALKPSMPSQYLGRVRLYVETFSLPYEVFRQSSTELYSPPPPFIETQCQSITSRETLYHVIHDLQLVDRWPEASSGADAHEILSNCIEVEAVGENLIDLKVYRQGPQEAAELANAIVDAYRNHLCDNILSKRQAALDMLNAQEKLQTLKVEKARLKMNGAASDPNKADTHERLKHDYETQNLILVDMAQALFKEKADLSTPQDPIAIHQAAVPNVVPSKPSQALHHLLGTLVQSLVWFIPAGLVSMYLAHGVIPPRS